MSWYKQSKKKRKKKNKEKGHIAASQPDRDKEIDVDYTRAKMRDMFIWTETLLRIILFRANVRTVASWGILRKNSFISSGFSLGSNFLKSTFLISI